jgi:hypothetical protein
VSSATAPSPAPAVRPFGLARADLLKLRKRRGLVITVFLMTIGIEVLIVGITAILHAANPDHHGPVGGVSNLADYTGALAFLGSVAAIVAGTSAGTGDLRAGVFRELVITGRSRLALFAARVGGGLAFLLPFVLVAYAIVAVPAAASSGDLVAPSGSQIVEAGLWIVAASSFYFALGLGLGSLLGSQGPTIGILLAFRFFVQEILASIHYLGWFRGAMPAAAFSNLVPHGLPHLREVDDFHMSAVASVVVLLLWTAAALGIGAWRTATRDV